MLKSKRLFWNKSLILGTAFSIALFPAASSLSQASFAATPAPNPSATSTGNPLNSASPMPTASPTPSASPSASPSVSPKPSYVPGLYSIDAPDSIWVVVDKKRPLKPANYVPKSLVAPRFEDGAGINPNRLQLAKVAAKAIKQMATAMKAAGAGTLALASTYRSYNTQVAVHAKDVAALGLVAGENLAARPGYSEHQTGLAADLAAVGQGCSIQVCFATTKAGKWLAANSWQYGWILRYPNGRTATTGYQFEPWHFRYVGIELSTEMHTTGIAVLEDFFKLPAAPTY